MADFLTSWVVTQLFPLMPSDNLGAAIIPAAYAQSNEPVYLPQLTSKRGVYKGGLTGTSTEYCASIGADDVSESCHANPGDEIKYLIEVNLSGKDTQGFVPGLSTAGISITDSVGSGICNLHVIENPFGDSSQIIQNSSSCEPVSEQILFNEDLQTFENKTVESNWGYTFDFDDVQSIDNSITEWANGLDKIYAQKNWNIIKIYLLQPWKNIFQYDFNLDDWNASKSTIASIPTNSVVWSNHTLSTRGYVRNYKLNQNDPFNFAKISLDWWSESQILDLWNDYYWNISDLEFDNTGVPYVVAQGIASEPFLGLNTNRCKIINNQLEDCIVIKYWLSDNAKLDSNLNLTESNQYYVLWWNTVDVSTGTNDTRHVDSNHNTQLFGNVAWIANWVTNWYIIYIWNNFDSPALKWVWIYPKTNNINNNSSYQVNGTIDPGYVLGGFEGDLSDFDSYSVYGNATCAGAALYEGDVNSNGYTNIVDDITLDNKNVYEGDYCILLEGTANAGGQSVTVYQNRLNYYAVLEGNIDSDTTEDLITNTISNASPNGILVAAFHNFDLTTGTTTFEITKSVSGDITTGYSIGDEASFIIDVVASGDTSTRDLFIVDTLSGGVLEWANTDPLLVATISGNTDTCIIKSGQIEGDVLTVVLSWWILTGEENKCQIVINTIFTGYGCFANDMDAVKNHYRTLDSTNIPLVGSGATVCSTGLDNLTLEKFVLNTWSSDYNSVNSSTTEPFYEGDNLIRLIKWNMKIDPTLGHEDDTPNDTFVLRNVILQDSMSGVEWKTGPTIGGSPINPGDGYIAPRTLGDLTGGTSGYILITWTVNTWTAAMFTNNIKFVWSDEVKDASATWYFSGKKLGTPKITKTLVGATGLTYMEGSWVKFDITISGSGENEGFSGNVTIEDSFVGLHYSWYTVLPAGCATTTSNPSANPGDPIPDPGLWGGGVFYLSSTGACTIRTDYVVGISTGTATNTGCIIAVNGQLTWWGCSAVSIIASGSSLSGNKCTLTASILGWWSGTGSSGSALNFNCTANAAVNGPFWFNITDGNVNTGITNTSQNSFAGILMGVGNNGSPWGGAVQNIVVTCTYSGTNGTGSCTQTIPSTGTQPTGPPPIGESTPPKGGDSSPKKCEPKGPCEKKPKEPQASDFSEGATVPYELGIENTDPDTAMEGITFWDNLPAGMSMYEWKASIDDQIVKQGNKNGAKGRVELTPDLVGVTIPSGKMLVIHYNTKIDSGYNFWTFINPAAGLFECEDNATQSGGNNTGNNNPPAGGNSKPANEAGGGAENMVGGTGGLPTQSSPLPGAGTGANAGKISTGGNENLLCIPTLYDISVTKKILSEKIEVGKSLKFEITVRNEGFKTVTGLVIKDQFSGLATVRITSAASGIVAGYFTNAISGEFNIASGITLTSGQTISIVVDSVLSGNEFVNMVQACGYDDASDPDSDSCNGYDKLEDDSSIVSGGINTSALGDRIWYDTNEDGLQTSGEKWVNDLVVQLIMCGTDVVVGSWVKTNGDGNYVFNNMIPGKYAIRFDLTTLPAGFTLTAKNVGTDDSIDSDSDKIDGKYALSECITLTGGQSYLGHDLGIVSNASGLSQLSLSKELMSSGEAMTSGSKLLFKITATNDGVYGQSGVQIKDKWLGLTGIKVWLSPNNLTSIITPGNDLVIRSGMTLGGTGTTGGLILGASGANQVIIYVEWTLISWAFSNYAQLCNYTASKELQKPPYPNKPCNNSMNEPDDDIVSGSTIAGNLGDFVWIDSNVNGLQSIGEKGAKDIDLELYTCTNTTTKIASAKTDSNGLYKFQNIAVWQYKIKIVLTGVNSKYSLTAPLQGTDKTKDSNGLLNGNITDCITVSGWISDTSIDFGLILATPDIKVTKTVKNMYVNVWDTAVYTVTLENIGSWTVNKYVFTDTLASGLSLEGLNTNDKIALTSGSVAMCGSPSDGWKSTTINGNTSIVGNMSAANIQAGQKCVYTIKAKVTAANGAQLNNSIVVSAVQDETNTANNSANVLVYPLPLCDLIKLSGDAGNAPFMLNYSIVPANPGTIRLLDSEQNSIWSSQLLNGSFNILNPGIYYIEYYTGSTPPTTGQCIRPVIVKSLAECTNLATTKISDTSYNVVCQGNYANQYKLQMFYETTGANKTWVQAPNGVINTSQGNFTFPRNNQQLNYKFTCTINSGINYGLDKITPYNGSNNQFECAYKNKSDGKICAIQTFTAPLKVPAFSPGIIAQLPDPIEYCTAQEKSTSTCVVGNVSAMLIKNYDTCEKLVSYDLPDLLVTKSADKAGFATGESITYTIDVRNIGSGVAKGVKLEDKIIWSFKIEWYPTNAATTSNTLADYTNFYWDYTSTILNPGQNIQFKYTVKLLNANIEQISNTATTLVATGFESNYANNTTNLTIGKQGEAKIGDLVWLDINKNGIKDDTEKGIKDLQIQLIGCNDVSPKLITKTDANGFYQFIQIGSGSYRVMVQVPDTYRVSPRNVGSFDKDSNLDPLTNVTECFSITNGQIKFDIDAGLFVDPTIPPQNPFCGNKIIEPQHDEQCDGNTVAADSVCQNCQIIKNSLAICGNSVREPGEDCEVWDVPNGKTCYNCKLTTNSVCGDGKVTGKEQGGYEECDINTPAKPGYQCIWCIEVPNSLANCWNGRQELGEACDLGASNGTNTPIPTGVYAGKKCTASCNVVNKIGEVILSYEPPSCTEIDPPSAMEGEYFPFWWDIADDNVVTSCTQSGQVLRDSMRCYFDLYAGEAGTNNPIQSIETNCYNTNQFQNNLLDWFNASAASKYGRHSFLLDPAKIANKYWEYKLRLKKINYQVCSGIWSSTVNGSIAPFNTFNDSYDETICEYNFTVSRPYLMQEGWLLSSNATDSLNNFYGFSSNAGTQSILTQYSIKLQNVWLNEFVWSQNINYLMDDFAKKYTLLAVENINLGANTLKVPGKEIYIFKGNYTYNESSFTSGKPKTIIVSEGNLNIVGNVSQNTLFVVPKGDIIIGTDNCNVPQTILGIYLTKGSIVSDKNYINNNLSNNWCEAGNLTVRGLLVGSSIQDLVSKRRSTLEGWFMKGNKKDAIVNWASVLIKSNDRLFTEPAPGLDEFTKELSAYKK